MLLVRVPLPIEAYLFSFIAPFKADKMLIEPRCCLGQRRTCLTLTLRLRLRGRRASLADGFAAPDQAKQRGEDTAKGDKRSRHISPELMHVKVPPKSQSKSRLWPAAAGRCTRKLPAGTGYFEV